MLCGKCKTPLQYKRYCPNCKKEVAWQDVVRGLKLGRGIYYVFEKGELEKLKPEKSDVIEILFFTDAELEPVYFNKNYYLVPTQEKEKAYFLMKQALEALNMKAVVRLIFKEKEYIGIVQPYRDGMLLTTLNYAYEIRDINKIEILKSKARISEKELALAKELIKKFYKKTIPIEEFKDTFAEKLKELIKKKMKGEKVVVEKVKKVVPEKNLMQALEATIKEVKVKK